ncbi:MAG: hypothetical protein Q4G60_10680 [bacterium]|nr:hypothetical protein [bacterium]
MAGELTELEQKKRRLALYYEKEEQMLSKDGIASYGIGSRNISRYQLALSDIRQQIKELEDDIKEISGAATGSKRRKAVAVVPRDV